MSTPIIFRDVNFKIYTITDNCTILKNGTVVSQHEITYNSTNGYDYVMLETLTGGHKLYRLEFLMASSFNPGIQNKWEHFRVIHLDRNRKNCRIDNLRIEEDIEEWRTVMYPANIKRDKYSVSSWGRIKNNVSGKILTPMMRHDGYVYYNLGTTNSCECVPVLAHRLVCGNFYRNTNDGELVNHLDGVKSNNHISNLEWSSYARNIHHALLLGLNDYIAKDRENLNSNDVDRVIEMLLDPQYGGSCNAVYRALQNSRYNHIAFKAIRGVKNKNPRYFYPDSKYDLRTIVFPEPQQSRLSTEDVDMIIEMLLDPKYDGSPKLVYEAIDHEKYPHITFPNIQMTKMKRKPYIREDSKYDLRNLTFANAKQSKISSDDVDMVIEMLLSKRFNGSIKAVYDALDHDKYPYVTRKIVEGVKNKKPTYLKLARKYDLATVVFHKEKR